MNQVHIITNEEEFGKIVLKLQRPWVPIAEALELLGWEDNESGREKLNKLMKEKAFRFNKRSAKDIIFERKSILNYIESQALPAYQVKKIRRAV